VRRWRVGSIEIVRVADEDFALPVDPPLPRWCVEADLTASVDESRIAFTALAIRSGPTRIVVDPWLANDFPRAQPDAADRAARLLGTLGDAGFAPTDVDIVVNTHIDGIGWNTRPSASDAEPSVWEPSFPNARYIIPVVELTDADAGHHDAGALVPLRTADLIDAIPASFTAWTTKPDPLPLTHGVSLVNAPGHNTGHVAVRIEEGDALAIYAGHLFLTPQEIARPCRDDDEDPAVAEATRRTILDELVERGGLLLTTLIGGEGAGIVRLDDEDDDGRRRYRLDPFPHPG
jgi:glyoxylase-like metal-dependent hydrolase (beta-lactamase superfamily II)